MVREFISDLVLIIFFTKLMVQPLWTHLGVVKSSPISIFHGQKDIKSELWHLQARFKCLNLCFYGQGIHFWAFFDDIFHQIHCLALRNPFSGSQIFSDFNISLRKWCKTWTLAPTSSIRVSKLMFLWSENSFLSLFW